MTLDALSRFLDNSPLFIFGVVLLNFLTINDDGLTYGLLGMIGAFIGQIVYLAKRDKEDVNNTIAFITIKDIFAGIGWMLVGGFFPLVLSLPAAPKNFLFVPTPILAILCSPFVYYLWDVFAINLPLIVGSFLARFETTKGQKEAELDNLVQQGQPQQQPTNGTGTGANGTTITSNNSNNDNAGGNSGSSNGNSSNQPPPANE